MQRLPDADLEKIKLEDAASYDGRSRKLKAMPIEIIDYGVHKI